MIKIINRDNWKGIIILFVYAFRFYRTNNTIKFDCYRLLNFSFVGLPEFCHDKNFIICLKYNRKINV